MLLDDEYDYPEGELDRAVEPVGPDDPWAECHPFDSTPAGDSSTADPSDAADGADG